MAMGEDDQMYTFLKLLNVRPRIKLPQATQHLSDLFHVNESVLVLIEQIEAFYDLCVCLQDWSGLTQSVCAHLWIELSYGKVMSYAMLGLCICCPIAIGVAFAFYAYNQSPADPQSALGAASCLPPSRRIQSVAHLL